MFRRNRITDFNAHQSKQFLPHFDRCFASGCTETRNQLLQVVVFGRQQRAIGYRSLLWLRDIHLARLDQVQHLLQLRVSQLAQHGMAKILADKVANGLAVIALWQQLG